jgi:hypothetical protein
MDGRRAHRRPYRKQLERAPGTLVLVILPRSTHLVPPLGRSVFSGLRQADSIFRGSRKKCEGGQSIQIVSGQPLAPGDVPRGHRLDLGERANRIAEALFRKRTGLRVIVPRSSEMAHRTLMELWMTGFPEYDVDICRGDVVSSTQLVIVAGRDLRVEAPQPVSSPVPRWCAGAR